MSNSTTAPLQGVLLLSNQLELITPTTMAGTLYGVAFTLFCLYVHSVASHLRDEEGRRRAIFMLGYSAVITLCGMGNLVLNAWITQNAYIKHSGLAGGPLLYIVSNYNTPAVPAALACQMVIDALTSAVQIWRVWVIWSATRFANLATILPILCFLSFTVLEFRSLILDTTLPAEKVSRIGTQTQVAKIAIQASTTMLCTMLISIYLISMQWQQRKLIGKPQGSTGYMNIVAMLIESYVLEFMWWLIVFTLIVMKKVEATFFTESAIYIEVIAYLLVQYRVARGKACESQRRQSIVTSLHWDHTATQQTE